MKKSACITRREALAQGLLGAAALAWTPRSFAAAPNAEAKAVIQIWMWGGACHLDTFDPKPEAGYDYCGPLKNPIATNVDGIQISELLPQLAQQADKYSIIRSMTHNSNAHETASYLVQTGRDPGRLSYPAAGAVVSLFKGYDYGYQGLIPPYIVLTDLQGRFSETGFLGQRYRPFATGGNPNLARFAVEGIVSEEFTEQRQQGRRQLLHDLDTLGAALPENESFARLDRSEKAAYELILGDTGKVFDLNSEPSEIREKYGKNSFGQSCLMARRLVERGVPYVTINYRNWDTHKKHFEAMKRNLPDLDQGMGTLLSDLAGRGLLDSTIVWWGGEFGRTPKIQWEPPWSGGRGHYGRCFSTVVAGGGFKGGHVIGASDARGEEVAERPVAPKELLASMYTLLGIDPNGPLKNASGIDAQVMPDAARLTEIM